MRALGRLVVAGPYQAVLAIVLCIVLGVFLPPLAPVLGYVAAAALVLHSLQLGARAGAIVLLASVAVVALLIGVLTGQQLALAITAILLALWTPLWLASVVLRETRSFAMAVLVFALLGMLAVLLVYLLLGDPVQWWPAYIKEQLDAVLAAQPELSEQLGQLSVQAERFAPVLAGSVAAGLVMNSVLGLALGRWWQAVILEKPGVVRAEFFALRFNRTLSLAGFAIFALAVPDLGVVSALALQWSLVIMVPFLFAGLAVAHVTLNNLKAGLVWLVFVYIAAILVPQLLVALGMLDPWLDLRRRTARAETN